jgi:MFS family permease
VTNDPARGTLVVLVTLLTCSQTVLAGARVAVSLDALHRGVTPAGVGLLIAMFALLPMLCALHAGRLVDRVGVAAPMLAGLLILGAGVSLPSLLQGLAVLYVAATLMGIGFMMIQVSVQRAVGDLGVPADRAGNFGMLALGSSIANFAGPLLAGLSIDSFGHRIAFGALSVLPCFALGLMAFRYTTLASHSRPGSGGSSGLFELLAHKPLRRLYLVNAFVSIGWDVHTVFVPIYGSTIGLTGAQIGGILASFAAASFVVRFAIRWIAVRWSERAILVCAFAMAASMYVVFPMTDDPWALAAASFVLGLGLGTGQPMVMSLLHEHAPTGRLGEAAGIRISLIQSVGVAVPLLFGALGSSLGLVAVFWGAAFCLGLGGVAAKQRPG